MNSEEKQPLKYINQREWSLFEAWQFTNKSAGLVSR